MPAAYVQADCYCKIALRHSLRSAHRSSIASQRLGVLELTFSLLLHKNRTDTAVHTLLPLQGRRGEGEECLIEAVRKIRSDASPGEDAAAGIWAIRGGKCEEAGKKKPATFDFLGLTHICARSRRGKFTVNTNDESAPTEPHGRRRMVPGAPIPSPVDEQQKTLNAKLRGHYQYYGRPTNSQSVGSVREEISRCCHGGPKRARSWKHTAYRTPLLGETPVLDSYSPKETNQWLTSCCLNAT